MSKIVRGSCLCGGVRFEVEPPFIRAGHCHCERCRKHSGTAVCTQARVKKEQFRLLQGEDLIRVYGKGEGAVKAFCLNCGSSLFGGDWPEGYQVSIRMGAFDDDQEFARNFTRSSTTARRGTRSPTICRNIVELGARMRGLSQNDELFHESDAIASGSKFAGLRLEIPRLRSE